MSPAAWITPLARVFALGVGLALLVPSAPGYADDPVEPTPASSSEAAPAETESPAPESPASASPEPSPEPAPSPSPSEPPPASPEPSESPAEPSPSESGSSAPPAAPQPSAEPSESASPTPEAPASPGAPPPAGAAPTPTVPSAPGPVHVDPGADLYPQPPFAPVTGNPSAALLQQLYDAQTRQRSLRNQITATEQQLSAAETAVADAKEALAGARRTREAAAENVQDSVVEMYKSGAPYGLYSVLESSGAGLLRDGTRGQLADLADATDRVDLLSDQLAGAVDARDALAVALADLRLKLRDADTAVKRLQTQTTTTLSAVPAAGVPVGSTLLWPLSGPTTSEYGNRYDPYYHRWQLHAGIDIAAPTGTPVRAAAAGQVVQAGWNGGYGNYICLAHGTVRGQQMTTCYAHLSQMVVAVGQTVVPGQTIGAVGSTGASTGPHLHFEVRLGGRPTDPRLWL